MKNTQQIIQALQTNQFETAMNLLNKQTKQVKKSGEYLYFQGVFFLKTSRAKEAYLSFDAAVKAGLQNSECYSNMGLALRQLGQLQQCVNAYQQALKLNPQNAAAHNNLGNVFVQVGQYKDAENAYKQALNLNVAYMDAYKNLADLYRRAKHYEQALQVINQGLKQQGNHSEIVMVMASVYIDQKNYKEADSKCRMILGQMPYSTMAHAMMGRIKSEMGEDEKAESYLKAAIKIAPDNVQAAGFLVNLYNKLHRFDEALALSQELVERDQTNPMIHRQLAHSYKEMGNLEQALKHLKTAVYYAPQDPDTHMDLGFCQILAGELEDGYQEYEWRLKSPQRKGPKLDFPYWDGIAPLEAKTILVYAEQGMGANIHYARYIELLAQKGASVYVETYKPLVDIFSTLNGAVKVYSDEKDRPTEIDYCLSMLSMPGVFKTQEHTIPTNIPYFKTDQSLVTKWSDRLKTDKKLTVGLVWQGNSEFGGDGPRSMQFKQYWPLLENTDIHFVSIQVGFGREQLAHLPDGLTCDDLGGEIKNFTDTAAIAENVDLLISTDTSTPHLMGALGRPVWMVLPYIPDWRFQLHREDMPWYPNMRLFRQSSHGDWKGVIERINEELSKLLGS